LRLFTELTERIDVLLFGEFSLQYFIAVGLVLLIGMGWHEYAHALVADWWGDPTPRENGRITPNPLVHIYWPGWLMFVIIGFGILGYVPVNERRMRDPRWGAFWTALAGPVANLVMALVSAILLRLFFDPFIAFQYLANPSAVNTPIEFIGLLLITSVLFNALLFVFNLLPFFPIDGWRIVLALLPGRGMRYEVIPSFVHRNLAPIARFLQRPAYKWQEWAQLSQYVLLGLILLSFLPAVPNPLGEILGGATFGVMRLFLGL
jgi:Zn-dependent protease